MSANASKTDFPEDEKHFHHVLGGYKATLSNEKSSDEAREHAERMIEYLSSMLDVEVPAESTTTKYSEEEKHLHHVIGGYKATLSNDKSSEEARKNAQSKLDGFSGHAKEEKQTHRNRVIGGYKATLSNDKSSEEAKKHAQEMLDKLEKGEKVPESSRLSNKDATDTHVAGGYKATLSNPNASEEAKKHAQEMLDKAGVDANERLSDRSNNDASDTHVAGGYKATLSNPNASEEAKKHAREMLEKAGVDPEERLSDKRDDLTEEEKHRHHVEGGYKATLANSNASEEAKKHAQEMLDKLAKGEELPESEKRGLKRSTADVESEDKESESGKGKQGFASMPHEKVQEIASKGGRTANAGEEPAPKKAAK